jgi:hypothetical protein
MVQRGIREHCDWLSKTGGLPVNREDGRSEPMSAGTAAVAIGVGCELGFPMNVALTKVTVIKNRPAIYGDVALALIRKRGLVDPKRGGGIRWWFTGAPGADDYTAHVEAIRSDTGETLGTSFSIGDAKRAGLWGSRAWVKWGALRMLRYRALGFLCRDLFSDVLLGVHLAEELMGEEGGGAPVPPPMTPPAPEGEAGPGPGASVSDPLWGAEAPGEVVEAEVVQPPAAPESPASPPESAEGATEEPAAPEEPSQPPPAAPAAAEAVPSSVDVLPDGRRVLERDAEGRPVVLSAPPKPPAPPAPNGNGGRKPKPPTPPPAPAAPKPAPPVSDDVDVARVKAAVAAARAKAQAEKGGAKQKAFEE